MPYLRRLDSIRFVLIVSLFFFCVLLSFAASCSMLLHLPSSALFFFVLQFFFILPALLYLAPSCVVSPRLALVCLICSLRLDSLHFDTFCSILLQFAVSLCFARYNLAYTVLLGLFVCFAWSRWNSLFRFAPMHNHLHYLLPVDSISVVLILLLSFSLLCSV